MPDPITFATEAERLAAREQFVTLVAEVLPFLVSGGAAQLGRDFDRRFPPITPPKMVPFKAWAILESQHGEMCVSGVQEAGNWQGGCSIYKSRPEIAPEVAHIRRVARVRVEEIEEGK